MSETTGSVAQTIILPNDNPIVPVFVAQEVNWKVNVCWAWVSRQTVFIPERCRHILSQ